MIWLLLFQFYASAFDLSGTVNLQARQAQESISEPQKEGRLVFKPQAEGTILGFDYKAQIRLQAQSTETDRSAAETQDFYIAKEIDQFSFRLGSIIDFWGVVESFHLVDTINQVDVTYDIFNEDKIGQPAFVTTYTSDNYGALTLYALFGTNERVLPCRECRFSPDFAIGESDFEAASAESQIDYAVRWTHNWGKSDWSVSLFKGTERQPLLFPVATNPADIRLVPVYREIIRPSLEWQISFEETLLKLEAIHVDYSRALDQDYTAAIVGVEHNFYGVTDNSDIAVFIEYLYDDRQAAATIPFDNDIFTAVRFSYNSDDPVEAKVGVISDLNNQESVVRADAKWTLRDSIEITAQALSLLNIDTESPLLPLRDDSYIELGVGYFF